MVRWGLVVDLKRCIACQTCTLVCKLENGTPPGIFFVRVLEREVGKYPNVRKLRMPISCFHCKEAPCELVCPSKATAKRQDGIITIDYERCIGCKKCIAACPYGAGTYLDKIETYYPGCVTPYEEVKLKKYKEKTVVKCTLCVERIEKGLEPICVVACPTNARYFGDLEDSESEVSRLIKERGGFQLRPEAGTDPSVYYLPH